jgi:Thioredoxin
MAPAWDRLAEDWADHDVAVIATIDCTQEPGLCEDFDVTGYPTLYFGNPDSPELYDGGRDYDSLSTFAKDNLGKAYCSVYSTASCSDDEKKVIDEFEAKSTDDLAKFVAEVEEKAEAEEESFDAAAEALQNTYEKMVEEYNVKVETLKAESNYHLAKAVLMKKDNEAFAADSGSEGGEL